MSTPTDDLASYLTWERIRDIGPDRFFWRGVNYALEDRVKGLSITTTAAAAIVEGRRPYAACIFRTPGGISYGCTCPVDDHAMCKHLMALALVVVNHRRVAAGEPSMDWLLNHAERINHQLEALGSEQMQEIILAYMEKDPDFRSYIMAELDTREPFIQTLWPPIYVDYTDR